MSRAKDIATALGNASREGRNWRCRCPLHDGTSLTLRDGREQLLVTCWAGCETSAILKELHRRGLLGDDCPPPPPKFQKPRPRPAADVSNERLALRIWSEAVDLRGTIGERYLSSRRIVTPHRAEEALRFHPRCPFKDDRVPAMVALLRDIRTDEPCGIHRTALLRDGSDRDRVRGKAMLGRATGAAIKISPNDEVTLGLGIAEGIKSALSIINCGWQPVWSAGSAGAIAGFPVLGGIDELTVFADCDINSVGQRAARTCAQRWREAGRLASIRDIGAVE